MSTTISFIEPRTLTFGGLTVRRYLPSRAARSVGPWLFFDHIGPATFRSGEGIDVIPHPHINLATVTYLFDGEIVHRDSLGNTQTISPGAINLMTAGKGITHSERTGDATRSAGHKLHGIQLWAGMTVDTEEQDPSFSHHPKDSLPTAEIDGATVRVMMGSAFGLSSPVSYAARILYAEVTLAAAAKFEVSIDEKEAALLPVSGNVSLDGQVLPEHRLAILDSGGSVSVHSDKGCRFTIIGGTPLGRRYMWWNFVSSRMERIEQAKQDWKQGNIGTVIDDTEYTPLPESDSFSDMKE